MIAAFADSVAVFVVLLAWPVLWACAFAGAGEY
jgi:hypothetical protein